MRNPQSAQVAEGDTRSTPVSTVMTVDPITIDPDAELWSALRTLLRTGLRHLVVEDVDGVYCGILGDRHVVAAWPAEAIGALGTLVRQMVRDPAPSILSTTTVDVAARAMLQAGTDALAVVDTAGRVQEIVTGSDLDPCPSGRVVGARAHPGGDSGDPVPDEHVGLSVRVPDDQVDALDS